ncbi:hypothetical protein GCM10023150_10310 [Kangiella taiwanensis]|uniref:Uncharacterized protein n=1 Tax=Kangiella taiwanensis TaxID=1079179 RepID=A0ABP8HYR4_9GAMM
MGLEVRECISKYMTELINPHTHKTKKPDIFAQEQGFCDKKQGRVYQIHNRVFYHK